MMPMTREKKMTIEPIRRLLLFGGAPPLLHAVIHARKRGLEVRVVTEELHLEEDVNQGRSLRSSSTVKESLTWQ